MMNPPRALPPMIPGRAYRVDAATVPSPIPARVPATATAVHSAVMESRRLGRTALEGSVIGMGTWQTYDVRDPAAVQPITDAVLAHGATFFDSSPMYGAAERVLAATLGDRRKQVVMATKVWAGSASEGREQIRRALEWYGGVVDLYQIHNLEAWQTHLPYLEELKARGRIRAIGITHWSPIPFDRMAENNQTGQVETIQVPYNPREREVEHTLLARRRRRASWGSSRRT